MSKLRSFVWLLAWAFAAAGGGESVVPPVSADEVLVAVAQGEETADPFARLRRSCITAPADYWASVGQALASLETLDGAAYNARYGVLTLHGKPASEGQGPFHLDDLMVALQAALFHQEELGMTIDPDPHDRHGPEMVVRYFGGCEDTAFGWILFECDRLLKSLSNGEDNLTRQPLAPNVDEFLNMLELGLALEDATSETSQWNRFWLSTDLNDGPSWYERPEKSNGHQPVVFETPDGSAIALHRCRLYLRTEVMEWKDGQLVSASGQANKAAARFAKHFNVYFDDFARLYPVFARAASLARLTVLAEWIVKSGIPMDVPMIRGYQPQVRVRTPTVTPANNTSLTARERVPNGLVTHVVKSFGGVDFQPRTFFADDVQNQAGQHRRLSDTELANHPQDIAWRSAFDGKPIQVVTVPTWHTQVTPAAPPRRVETAFRRSQQPAASPGGRLPSRRNAPVAGVDRSVRVAREAAFSLDNIDRLRGQRQSSPTERATPLEVCDARYVARTDRGALVGRDPLPLHPDASQEAHPIRGPPAETGKPAAATPDTKPRPAATDAAGPAARGEYSPGTERGTGVGREPAPLKPLPNQDAHPVRGPPETTASFRPAAERVELVARERIALPPRAANAAWGFPVYQTAERSATYNLPRLVERANSRRQQVVGIQGRPETQIHVLDQLTLVSELGDIMVHFDDPEIDSARGVMYYPPAPAGAYELVGYYPQTQTLEFRDGMHVKFDEHGWPAGVQTADGTSFEFQYAARSQADDWPHPLLCRVQSASGRAEPGTYRLTDEGEPPAASASVSPPASHEAEPSPPANGSSAEPTEDAPGAESSPPATPPASAAGAAAEAAAGDVLPAESSGPTPDIATAEASAAGDVLPAESSEPTPDIATADASAVASAANRPSGREIARVTPGRGAGAGRPPHASAAALPPLTALAELPVKVHPLPNQLSYGTVPPRFSPHETVDAGVPLRFLAERCDVRWSARLRSRFTPQEVYESSDWAGDEIRLRTIEGSPVQVALATAEGVFAPGQVGQVPLDVRQSAEATPSSDGETVADFFVDVRLEWRDGEETRRGLVSLPVRLESRRPFPAGIVVVGLVSALMLALAAILGLRR